jgi:hypothetical protein
MYYEENWYSELQDLYGEKHVFTDNVGYNETIYLVQDDAQAELYSQPSFYSSTDDAMMLDEGPQYARENLPDYAQSVLDNYYELHSKIIPKYEQKIGQKFEDGTVPDPNDNDSGFASFRPDYSRQLPPKRTF